MIKLFHFPICPFSRRVRITLSELNIQFTMVNENIWDKRREFLAVNPAGSLPVMIDDQHNAIVSSYAIIEFIQEKFEINYHQNKLDFGDIYEQAEIRRLVDWFDNKFYTEVTRVILKELVDKYYIKNNTNTTSPNMELIRIAQDNLHYHLDYLTHLINSRKWIGGDFFSQADIAASAHLSCLDFLSKLQWDVCPVVKNWYSRIKSRPSFSGILSDSVAGFYPPSHYPNPDF